MKIDVTVGSILHISDRTYIVLKVLKKHVAVREVFITKKKKTVSMIMGDKYTLER